ncbi:NUDIX hydrolase [Streptomyces tubercidicus]|uniref:NUDIX hydrolase n=1 Tax=Streptomyces tubercidicus TaxID=47759 RepID=UPI0013595316|nr:NUDIX domain-containing protein [Streptomyces tubercidicus]WAU11199.1 NUDIX domain-containing protein [Streptomyces tubercidicus]
MRTPRQAAGVAVLDPGGALFLLRYDNEEVGLHWAMPGGGLDPGETPWWTPAELAASADPLRPPRLADLLALWRGRPGHATAPEPVDLGLTL